MGISLYVSGSRACFSRPEALGERLSYEIITPSVARALIEAIHWKPVIRWVIDTITVLNPIRWETKRTTKVTGILRDVAYVIDAHAEETGEAGERDLAAGINIVQKQEDIFRQRLADGECVRQPCLGLRDYSACVTLFRKPRAPCFPARPP